MNHLNDINTELTRKGVTIEAVYLGGSTLYGLDTPESDVDYKGLYLLDNIYEVLGLPIYSNRDYESIVYTSDDFDYSLHELRKYVHLLSRTNTAAIEMLYAPDSAFLHQGLITKSLRRLRQNLICSKSFYNTLVGYLTNEFRLMVGERTGRLGGKRKDALEKYGYSYKNLVNMIRLVEAGCFFFETGFYPVDVKKDLPDFYDELIEIKTNPSVHNNESARKRVTGFLQRLEDAYKNRNLDFQFNSEIANELIVDAYVV